jgi:hypothetical protein
VGLKLTYFLLQNRHIRPIDANRPPFPAKLAIKIRFGPDDAFGVKTASPRTTAKRAAPAHLTWNANEAVSFWEGEFIDKIQTSFEIGKLAGTWDGNVLTLIVPVSSEEDSNGVILSANHILPAALSFRLRVFVWIKEFTVKINGSSSRVETVGHRYGITIATTEHNQHESIEAVKDWLLTREQSLRLVMAMYYFRHAERLSTIEPDRQSMTAEVILNLTKAIELIFTAKRDVIREKSKEWGIDSDFIEKRIIPLFLIRNELDVSHVATAPLRNEQQQSLLNFTDRALSHVYELLSKISEMERSGRIKLDAVSATLDKDKGKLLSAISKYANE